MFTAETTDRGRPLFVRRAGSEKDSAFDQWQADFDRVRKTALAHPVNAVRLACRRSGADLRCRLDAVGTQTSRVPLPAWAAPYSFWCFDRDRHLTRAADVGAPAPGPPTTIDLKPGERYEIALPAGTRCEGSLMLSIRSPSPESELFNTIAIPSGPIRVE